jgi:proteic killer suppression protein
VYLANVIKTVILTARVKKDLRKVPSRIQDKMELWIRLVESTGLEEVRKIPGFHDEPLKGQRKGERSIRLSKAYRANYVIVKGRVECAEVQEVNRHEY